MTATDSASTCAFRKPNSDGWLPLQNAEADQGSVKNREELKAVLLASLQMQHVVVLAGCGCSIGAGGPKMEELWTAAVGSKPTANAEAVATKIHYDLKNNKNIETLLSKIEAYLEVNSDDSVTKFLLASKQTILEKCAQFIDPEKLESHRIFLHRLSRRRARDQRLRVFTTNYDLCFERAASALGGIALDGFSFGAPRFYDPRFFAYDIVRRPRTGDDFGNYLEGVFLLYKLHGSVNWARSANGAITEQEKPDPSEACLIYPANGKYQQSFAQPHLEAISQYLAAIREPNTCVLVIGFGFNDDHLSEPLMAAAQSNSHLRLIVVDSKATDKAKKESPNKYWSQFAELSRRGEDVWFIQSPFNTFAEMIPDLKSLTPAEKLVGAIKDIAGAK